MYLKELQLIDFKNIRNETFKFDKINLIVGENWSGKTSVLQAIEILYTDNFDDKISEYVNWESTTGQFLIKGNYVHQGQDFQYWISGGEKGTSRELKVGDEVFTGSDAVKKMREYVNPVLTLYSAISSQHDSTSILFEKPAEKLQKLKTIFGLDSLDQIVEEMTALIKETNDKIALVENDLKNLEARKFFYQERPAITSDIKALQEELKDLKRDKIVYDAAAKMYDSYLQELNKYESSQNTIKALQSSIAEKNSALEAKSAVRRKPSFEEEDLLKCQKDLDDLKEGFSNWKVLKVNWDNEVKKNAERSKRVQELTEKVNRTTSEVESLQKQVSSKKEEISKLPETDLSGLRGAKDKCSEDMLVIESEIKKTKNHIELCESGKCPTCEQDFKADKTDLDSTLKSLEQELSKLKLERELHSKNITDLQVLETELQKIESQLSTSKAILVSQAEELDKASVFLMGPAIPDPGEDTYSPKIAVLETELQELRDLQAQAKRIQEENQKLKEEQAVLQTEIRGLEDQIALLTQVKQPQPQDKPEPFDDQKIVVVEKAITTHENLLAEIQRIDELNLRIDEEKRQVTEDKAKRTKEKQALENELQMLQESRKILDKKFSAYLIEDGINYLNAEVNSFFQRIHEGYEVQFQQNKNSVDFYYSPGNGIKKSVILASGMEKQLIALAFRVALCSIQNLGFIILDEADESGNARNSQKLYKLLLDHPYFHQYFIITHQPETIEFIQNEYHSKILNMVKGKLAA